MAYYISETVDKPFDSVIADVTARLKSRDSGYSPISMSRRRLNQRLVLRWADTEFSVPAIHHSRMKRLSSRISSACFCPAT